MKKMKTNKQKSLSKTGFYFPTGIYKAPLIRGNKVALKRLISTLENDIFLVSQSDRKGAEWSAKNYLNGYTSYSSLDRLDLMTESFEKLRKKIDLHVQKFLENLQYDCTVKDLAMSQCWANVMFENTVHTSHIHPQSIISGTFYVRIPAGASPIKFEDPRLGFFMNSPLVKASAPAALQRFIQLDNKPGDLVLFESWLRHEVPLMPSIKNSKKSTDPEPRISISFNYGKK